MGCVSLHVGGDFLCVINLPHPPGVRYVVCVCDWVHVLLMYDVRMYMCSVMFLLCMAASVDSRRNICT